MSVPAIAEELKVHFLSQIANGKGLTTAADRCGTSRRRIQYLIETDEEFREEYFHALDLCDERVEESVYRNAIDGSFQDRKFWLVNRRRERWVDPDKAHRSNDGDERREVARTAVDVIQAMLSDPQRASAFMKVVQQREIAQAKVIDVTSDSD